MLYEKTNAEKSLFAQCTWLERWRRRKKAAVVDYSCNIHCDWVNSCVVHHCSATMCVWWMSDKHTILDVDMDASNGFHFSLILLPQFSTCSWVEGNKKTSRLVAQKKPDDNWTFSKSFSNHKCICVIVSTFCRYFYAYFWWIRIQKKNCTVSRFVQKMCLRDTHSRTLELKPTYRLAVEFTLVLLRERRDIIESPQFTTAPLLMENVRNR